MSQDLYVPIVTRKTAELGGLLCQTDGWVVDVQQRVRFSQEGVEADFGSLLKARGEGVSKAAEKYSAFAYGCLEMQAQEDSSVLVLASPVETRRFTRTYLVRPEEMVSAILRFNEDFSGVFKGLLDSEFSDQSDPRRDAASAGFCCAYYGPLVYAAGLLRM